MLIPSSTYRIQLHEDFTFGDLAAVVGYLHELGISTVYASPITTAVKGSRHGYDVADALRLNPEIGTEQQLESLAGKLRGYDMSWLQDIVPNHMAYDASNPWLLDVLEKGRDSVYYGFFDIMADGKGDPLMADMPGDRLMADGLGDRLMADGSGDRLMADGPGDRLMAPFLGSDLSECLDKGEISVQETPTGFVIRYFDHDYPVAAELHDSIAGRVALINSQRPLLEQLLQNQHYVLTNAREADTRINYRRFFTINSLICLRMEDQAVFDAWHETLHRWHEKGWIDGLRVDHIDGLADPREYLQRLRRHFGPSCYVVAEKILTGKEDLPDDWPLEGTTGYDFLAAASQVLTRPDGSHALLAYYLENILKLNNYNTVVYKRKLDFLYKHMGGELNQLLRLLDHSPLLHAAAVDRQTLREALATWMASFSVYRAYPDAHGTSPVDRSILIGSMEDAKDRRPDLLAGLDFLASLCDYDEGEAGRQRLHFLSRLMQWTGPLAAKGIEDTTFYVYNPYIAHCEVGDSPGVAGIPADEFHRRMQDRQSRWPHTLNATTTHDTKRGEDSRIRLSFLSAVPREWTDAVTRWRELNGSLIQMVGGRPAPSPNDEYLIYQSLLGGFPADGIVTDDFRQRVAGWLLKALRESKTETNYHDPDEAYEQQCQHFVADLLRPDAAFLSVFAPFALDIIRRSSVYCLSQLALKLTAPGIPDIYQGSELWELSFVDPDNRRPVDFGLRADLLRQIKRAEGQATRAVFELLHRHRETGIEKLFLLYRVLNCRRQQLRLFADGTYIPVPCEGPLLAFLRRYRNDWALVAVPLLPEEGTVPLTLTLPTDAPRLWTDAFTGADVRTKTGIPCWPEGLPRSPEGLADWPEGLPRSPEGLSDWPVIVLTGSTDGD